MGNVILQIEEMIRIISNIIWPMFIPFLILMGIYITAQIIFNIKVLTVKDNQLNLRYILPQTVVALGGMMGTGTIIGFLGALSKLSLSGQIYVESVAIWALIGSIVLVPISYCETIVAKIVDLSPKDYIGKFISKSASNMYVLVLILIYIFAIGGIQFSGVDAVVLSILNAVTDIQPTEMQRILYIIIPIILLIAIIILNNKEKTFIHSMIGMVLVASVVYFIFFGLFIYKTSDYIPMYVQRLVIGFTNPISMLFGVPLGLIFGMQRVIQIAEPGLGTLALAATKSNASPRTAGLISVILTITLTVMSIIVTSYIASYGMYTGIIDFASEGVYKLVSYFDTVINVTGSFGLIILFVFIVLSALTTLLGGYLLLNSIIDKSSKTKNILYLSLMTLGGIIAIPKIDFMFNVLDILLIISITLNIVALAIFVEFEWKKYKIKGNKQSRDYKFKKAA